MTLRLASTSIVFVIISGCNGTFQFDQEPTDAGGDAASSGCASDRDCHTQNLHCDVATGECVPCLHSSECTQPGALICASHRCVGCGSDLDCGKGSVCDGPSGVCIAYCDDDGDCPLAAPCDASRGLCLACTGDAQCGGASPRCASATGRCVACVSDANCPGSAPLCDPGGACVACRTSADCAPPAQCDPVAHSCL